ncbi:DNA topoisomerase I [Acidimicrobium ferrooxidans DSM 10331]|uniref:DNA topoisomerase 1 n=1 Tax=Acidimicrobium ferrooxidans (strain DSM 10331 / JCM 15462 / NBRC 103882 / ICP) TaxID=525909 RepID=C7M1S8_ACIFD|nr:type I DNA topoisomerase [Acidimicrobium ferrooxidans]ACU54825.1 DNA topoisomerase I [Acidimicrobium ferrooxidans DSM 10331]
MPKPLVIVESPTKARTIRRYLGDEWVVEASVGHVRDLPRSAKEIPQAVKKEPWARLGVDTEHGFRPLYVIPPEKREQVKRLKALLADASELFLATDEDREGESIAWHLLEVLAPRVPVRRMVFHEITERAIREAVGATRGIDRGLVDAQETRRVLDRLFGYEVSPVLWKKVMPRLSAGRVQSVACRLLVERERERMAFRRASYFDVVAEFSRAEAPAPFAARLVALDEARIATGRDFDATGRVATGVVVLDGAHALAVAEAVEGRGGVVRELTERPFTRRPDAPFMTSTLQQEASRKLRFSAQRTMAVAQRLYEQGFITYMRTDSVQLAGEALAEARRLIAERFPGALPDAPRQYRSRVKNAQEAHEAIRPAGTRWRSPDEVAREAPGDEARLYELIWRRTLASQMTDARGMSAVATIDVALGPEVRIDGREIERATFVARGRTLTDPGFLAVYPEQLSEDDEVDLPPLAAGVALTTTGAQPQGHETQPPARYTEASLVRALEERGIGRPSTYAQIISTLVERSYAWRRSQALIPTFLGFAVVQLLERHFAELVDYSFTARLEDDLDRIAIGEEEPTPYLAHFYWGNGAPGLHQLVTERLGEIDARDVNSIPIGQRADGTPVVVRVGRYGPFLQAGEETASIPEDLPPDELTLERAEELLERGRLGDRVLGELDGQPVLLRTGRFGPYVQLGEGDDRSLRRASLLPGQRVETLSYEDAVALLSLPRLVGVDPESQQEIWAHNGRFGPYLAKGRDTRSLDKPEQLFTIDLTEALARFREPKRRGRSASVLELGTHPDTGARVVVRSGRYGPYVSDGEVNASLPRGVDPASLDLDTAVELLAERRARLGSGS